MTSFLLAAVLAQAPANLLRDGTFATGRGWALGPGRLVTEPRRCLRFEAPGAATQELLAAERETLSVAVDIRTANVRATGPAGYAFAAVYQLDERGAVIDFEDFAKLTGDHDWQRHGYTFETVPGARVISVRCGLFAAEGVAEFAGWTMVQGAAPVDADAATAAPEAGPTGRAAILDEPALFAGRGSSPAVVAEILGASGIQTDRLSAADLAAPGRLTTTAYDLIVLPGGDRFPNDAGTALLRYLAAGGSFISLGGYALNDLRTLDGGLWQPAADVLERTMAEDVAAGRTPLPDGSFDRTRELLEGNDATDGIWRRSHAADVTIADEGRDDRTCARVTVPLGQDGGEVYCDLPAQTGSWRISGWLKTSDFSGTGLAFLAIYEYDAHGEIVAWRDFGSVRQSREWTRFVYSFDAHAGSARWRIRAGFYRASGTVWIDDIQLAREAAQLRPLNTATGRPDDGLVVSPLQIGLFDPSVRLKRVASLRTASGQAVLTEPIGIQARAGGWQAVGVLGEEARWIPLLEGYDRFDRPCGAAAAMVVRHGGLFDGSVWVGFGVEDVDLFPSPDAPAAAALRAAVRFIERGLSLHELACGHRLYRDGEPVTASVRLRRRWSGGVEPTVRFSLRPLDGGEAVTTEARFAGGLATVSFAPRIFVADRYTVSADLVSGGAVIDTLQTGFVVERPGALARAPALRFAGNRFELNGRGLFLFGTDTYAYTYRSQHDNPLTWAQEHRVGRDFGLDLYENLQYSNPGWVFAEEEWRDFRAMAQSTQAEGLVFMPGMLVGHNVAVSESDLRLQSAQCAEYARRLRDVPALLYYINGDYQMRPGDDVAAVRELWRTWLIGRHGSLDAAGRAWGEGRLPAGDPPVPPPPNGRWDDPAQVDWLSFETWLVERWNEAHVAAVRQLDSEHPITSEYYQFPFDGMDLRLTIDGQDVSNVGYFDEPERDLELLPYRLAWNDLRARGKGVSLGEYGVKTHPAWAPENGGTGYHIVRTEAQAQTLFESVAAYTLAYGGAKIQNWCLVDSRQRVFPWGLFYPFEMIPKDVAYVHRNLSLLFRMVEPRDEPSPLVVCLPSRLRLGADGSIAVQSAYRAFETLLAQHARFDVIDDVEPIPATARAILLPSPCAIGDAELERLAAWVAAGGRLLVTGDVTLDAYRQPIRPERLERLCGVRLVERLGPFEHPAVRVEPAGATAVDGLYRHRLGLGTVLYTPDPLEMNGGDEAARSAAYASLLDGLSTGPPAPAWLPPARDHLRRPTRTGWIHLLNDDRVAGGYTLVQVDDVGRPRLALTTGDLPGPAGVLAEGNARYGLAALDDEPLATSEALLVAPFTAGELALPGRDGTWVLLTGDTEGGAWRALDRREVAGPPSLALDEDTRWCLTLVCRPGGEEAAVAGLEEMMSRPWERPGL